MAAETLHSPQGLVLSRVVSRPVPASDFVYLVFPRVVERSAFWLCSPGLLLAKVSIHFFDGFYGRPISQSSDLCTSGSICPFCIMHKSSLLIHLSAELAPFFFLTLSAPLCSVLVWDTSKCRCYTFCCCVVCSQPPLLSFSVAFILVCVASPTKQKVFCFS